MKPGLRIGQPRDHIFYSSLYLPPLSCDLWWAASDDLVVNAIPHSAMFRIISQFTHATSGKPYLMHPRIRRPSLCRGPAWRAPRGARRSGTSEGAIHIRRPKKSNFYSPFLSLQVHATSLLNFLPCSPVGCHI